MIDKTENLGITKLILSYTILSTNIHHGKQMKKCNLKFCRFK